MSNFFIFILYRESFAMVSEEKREEVLEILARLERERGIHVIFAAEAGSRAWGFASDDSDYDIRFVYTRRPAWYISVREPS